MTAAWRRRVPPARRMPLVVYLWAQFFLLCWWAVNFPGLLSPDSTTYVQHVTTGPWVANHSVLYDSSILASITLTGGIWLVTLAQTFVYAVILAVIASRVRSLGVRGRWAALPCLLIVFAPTFGSFVTSLWKDVPFAASNLLLAATLLKVIADRRAGVGAMTVRTAVVIGAELTAITLFRNNGFVVVAMAAVVLVVVLKGARIKMAAAGVAALVIFELCGAAVYPALGIKSVSSNEAYGVFYGDIAVVYSQDPAAFTGSELAVMRKAAPLSHWKSSDNCLISDPLFRHHWNHAAANAHRYQLAQIWLSLLKRAPTNLVGAHLCRASNAWKVLPTPRFDVLTAKTPKNLYGKVHDWPAGFARQLQPNPVSWRLYNIAAWSRQLVRINPLFQVLLSRAAGWTYLAYLAILIAALRNRWKMILLAAMPILVNQLTVMAANPAQLYRYTVVQLFLGMLFLPLVSARWPLGHRRPPVQRAGGNSLAPAVPAPADPS